MRTFIFAAVLLASCATSARPSAELASAAPVIAAEREFAADAAARGWVAAFRRYAAPDAIVLSPDPVNAQENLAQVQDDGDTSLDWRPAYAGVAQSGDFGFTTGPFQIRGREGIVGHYFTVWRKQRDGSWKWIFDAGTGVRDPGPMVALDANIPTLPVALESSGSAETAIAEVSAIEAQIANGDAVPSEALSRRLAHNARVNRSGAPAATDRATSVALVVADGGVGYRPLRQEAASSGDMVFTLGEVRDQHEGAERLRYYARIWQRRPEGWRVVFDEIVPRRSG